jgi:hypothetical protein
MKLVKFSVNTQYKPKKLDNEEKLLMKRLAALIAAVPSADRIDFPCTILFSTGFFKRERLKITLNVGLGNLRS